MNETAWRGSRDVWLNCAYEALIEAGVDAVRVQPLAKKLNLARTSFYWFFTDRDDLLSELAKQWRDKNTRAIELRCEAFAETVAEAMLNVFDCWLSPELFDAQFEFAVRSWALQSPDVAAQVAAADEARIAALTRMLMRYGHNELEANVRARTVYLVQIGYISMNTREDIALRMVRIPAYVEIFSGRPAEQRELDRFAARHGYRFSEKDG